MKNITKAIAVTVLTVLSGISLNAQQNRTVGDFTGIKAGDAFNIIITQSDAPSVKIDAPENVQQQIKTEVKDGILQISAEGNINTDKPVTIAIAVKSLNSLEVSGSSDVSSDNQLSCDKILIDASGAGDIRLDLKATDVTAKISGAGDITLKGTAQSLDATVSGAGNLKASSLEVDKAKVHASGAGTAKVNVKQSLDADVSGAGDIIYKGNPADRNVNITGAGSVRESKSGNGEETASDTTKFKLGNKKYIIIGDGDEEAQSGHDSSKHHKNDKEDFKHWNGFEIGVNGMLDYKNSLDLPASFLELNYAKSLQFGLNLGEKDFHLYKNYVNLILGLGFDFNHYAFQNSVTLNSDTSYLSAFNDSTIKFKKNNLNVSYLKIPLLVEFNTSSNPRKDFHIAVGAQVAYRIHAVTKQQFDRDDKHIFIKQRDDFNLEAFRYSAIARIGYNKVTVFADYGLNRLFKKDKGPQVYPFTVGATFSF